MELMQPLFQGSHISKQLGEFRLSDIDFTLPAGYIVGVIGRNGSGKTTLIRLLSGIYQADGEAGLCLGGVSFHEDIVKYKKQLAFVFNETPFPEMLSARDCARVYGHYYDGFDGKKYEALLREFEVPPKTVITHLSKGQKIRQQLAFALSYEARLYLLDEPAGNLDVEFRDTFYKVVRKMTADGSSSVILVSHLVEEMEQLADYILWLGMQTEEKQGQRGYQRYFGTTDELKEQFQLLDMSRQELPVTLAERIVGSRERNYHQEILVQIEREALPEEIKKRSRYADLKEIMYYSEKGDRRGDALPNR